MKKKLIKHRFLWQLLLTIAFFICVPLLLINWFAIHSSIRAVEEERMDTYRRYSQNFMMFFDSELTEMLSCSVDISVNKSINPMDDSLYLWDTFDEMEQYKNRVHSSSDVFLYSHGGNYMLGTSNSYDVSRFAHHFSKPSMVSDFQNTFSAFLANYSGGTQILPIDNPKNDARSGLLVFMPVTLRTTADSILIFHLSPYSLNDSFFSQADKENASLYLFDRNGEMLLYSNSNNNEAITSPVFTAFLSDISVDSVEIETENGTWHAFRTYNATLDLSFVVTVPDSEIRDTAGGISHSLNAMMWVTGLLIAIMLTLVIYINYSPILKLHNKYSTANPNASDASEIDSISHILDSTLTENRTLAALVNDRTTELSNHVLHSMLSGREVTAEERALLSLSNTFDKVFIVSIYDADADSELYTDIRHALTNEFHCGILVSNDLYEKCLLFVCAVADGSEDLRSAIGSRICELLREGLSDSKFKAGVGVTTDLETGMYNASLTSLIALDQSEYGKVLLYENAIRDFRHVEYYPNEQVLAFIRHIKEGNRQQAHHAFDNVLEQVRSKMISQLIEKYICHDILNTFIKAVAALDISLQEEDILALMHFRNLDDLKKQMSIVIDIVCDEIENRKLSVEKKLLNEIVTYIENNLTNPDLGREMLASHFGLTLNSVSSLINSMLGCSFREYLTTRRIDISCQLLSSTDLSVSEICHRSGFRDTSYFIKTFKNTTGTTPSVYRNSQKS